MEDDLKNQCLKAIYTFYDDFVVGIPTACGPGCSTCCTVNVVATSLEGRYMLNSPAGERITRLKQDLCNAADTTIYRPASTTNQIALACLDQSALPPDYSEHGDGKCVFLNSDGLCTVYEYRPFACRAMSSRDVCRPGGEAGMDPFLVSLNLALYQVIEHLDHGGSSGNLIDVLVDLMGPTGQDRRKTEKQLTVLNMPLPGFLMESEYSGRFRAFIRRLGRFKVGASSLGEILREPFEMASG